MKLVIASLLFVGAAAVADDSAYYQFKAPVVEEIASESFDLAGERNFQDCDQNQLTTVKSVSPVEAIDMADVVVDKIINLGKKVWAVIELGRPVTNIKMDTANALPMGIKCWADLNGWTPTQSKTYRISYENLMGAKVVDFAFRVLYTTGGSYKGQGKYITNTTVVPAHVNVAWGYTFNAETAIPTVFNSGSAEQPVGGMHINVNWNIKTVFRTEIRTESFVIGGDGTFKRLVE